MALFTHCLTICEQSKLRACESAILLTLFIGYKFLHHILNVLTLDLTNKLEAIAAHRNTRVNAVSDQVKEKTHSKDESSLKEETHSKNESPLKEKSQLKNGSPFNQNSGYQSKIAEDGSLSDLSNLGSSSDISQDEKDFETRTEIVQRFKKICDPTRLSTYHTIYGKVFKNGNLNKELIINTIMCLNEVGTELEKPDNSSAGNQKIQKLECEIIKSKKALREFRNFFKTYKLFSLSIDDGTSQKQNKISIQYEWDNNQWNLKNDEASWKEFYGRLFEILKDSELHLIDRSKYYTKKEEMIDFEELAKSTVLYVEAWNEYKANQVA